MAPDPGKPASKQRAAKPGRTAWLSLVLGYLAMVPFVVGAVAAWSLDMDWSPLAVELTVLWGCALLIFLAGARHGASFRTPGGPTVAQSAPMLWLFALGVVLLVGYLSLAILHPLVAHRGETLLVFERLRPIQMIIAILSLASLLWLVEVR